MASKLPQWKIDYIAAHLDERPRAAIARRLGVATLTVHKYIVRLSRSYTPTAHRPRNEALWDIVRREYPGKTGSEIDRAYGLPLGSAAQIARALGVRHSPEVEARIRKIQRGNLLRASKDPDCLLRRTARWKRTRRTDELRVMGGERQRTGFAFRKIPKRTEHARNGLVFRRGYLYDESDPMCLRYTPDTDRSSRYPNKWATVEDYFTAKYGLVFKPADQPADAADTSGGTATCILPAALPFEIA